MPLCLPTRFPTCARTATLPLSAGTIALWGSDEMPAFDAVVRFGRYPVSKRATQAIEACQGRRQIVADPLTTRDFNSQTTTFVAANPLDFVVALLGSGDRSQSQKNLWPTHPCRKMFTSGQAHPTAPEPERILATDFAADSQFEGSYLRAVLGGIPAESLLSLTANSMSVRALDAFYVSQAKHLTVLANRGLNGNRRNRFHGFGRSAKLQADRYGHGRFDLAARPEFAGAARGSALA